MDRKNITRSASQTQKLGNSFAKILKKGDLVLLYGDLGAGKTTFVQGLATAFGVKDRILSPTFVLQRSHQTTSTDIKILNHIDLYRLEKHTEIEKLELSEVFEEEDSVTLVEWADRLLEFKNRKGYGIWFKYIDDNTREIEIKELNGKGN